MVSDSVTDSGSTHSIDFSKKKRANWSSKPKQWKLDARRRQWIFHLKKRHGGEEDNGDGTKSFTEEKLSSPFGHLRSGRNDKMIYNDVLYGWNIESGTDSSAASSPTSVLTSKDPGSKSSDSFCCLEKMAEEEEEVYGDAFDNFEGFTDALNYFENESKSPSGETLNLDQEFPRMSRRNSSPDKEIHGLKRPLLEMNSEQTTFGMSQRNSSLDKAIHGDKSPLPEAKNPKQESSKLCRRKGSPKEALPGDKSPSRNTKKSEKEASSTQRTSNTEPVACPICYEEMDNTDLSFLPCPCGFKLCLFCHKAIVDNNGRCPSCRKMYERRNVSGEVKTSFQQRGRGALRLSPSFRGLDRA